ncbi:protein aveugle [Lingula anatina]|uniref:Protein aveugle n=1 Tax=Lingula anatina TaxID=7574 RepID=A0A1S3H4Z3_LINAN|nr:protein aveugle-like [Lingula anatina]XP_013380537.1 protein aveugle-like [Lingula anatina]XP_013413253.1 protein aveugle [Lingula anatina]XP_013413254.1 protein aveugle [Lingula anatina]XP_013413255.1 protein aveugle [Lingula anatina]|eukprot:XP_013380536.1 protein aveugle-like [Lingula anatina]
MEATESVLSRPHYVKNVTASSKTVIKSRQKEPASKKSTKGKGPKPLYFWGKADVNKWLRKHGGNYYQLYGQLFLDHEISGRALIRLSDMKLGRMGIQNPEHREDLMQLILHLKLRNEAAELKNLEQKGLSYDSKNK